MIEKGLQSSRQQQAVQWASPRHAKRCTHTVRLNPTPNQHIRLQPYVLMMIGELWEMVTHKQSGLPLYWDGGRLCCGISGWSSSCRLACGCFVCCQVRATHQVVAASQCLSMWHQTHHQQTKGCRSCM